jgi:hypothetical protein
MSQSQSQSQSYFTTGCSPPITISSSWSRAPWDSWPDLFSQLNTYDHSPYITSSLTRRWVCHLQLLLSLVSAFILGSESRGSQTVNCPLFLLVVTGMLCLATCYLTMIRSLLSVVTETSVYLCVAQQRTSDSGSAFQSSRNNIFGSKGEKYILQNNNINI